MAHSLKSAGDSVFASVSAAPSGKSSKSIGRRKRDWIDDLPNARLVEVTLEFIAKMGVRDAIALDICAAAREVPSGQTESAMHRGFFSDIDDQLGDRANEISARECVELLAKRLFEAKRRGARQ